MRRWLSDHGAEIAFGIASLVGLGGIAAYWNELVGMCAAHPMQTATVAGISFLAGVIAGSYRSKRRFGGGVTLKQLSSAQLAMARRVFAAGEKGPGLKVHGGTDEALLCEQLLKLGIATSEFAPPDAYVWHLTPRWVGLMREERA